MKDLKIVIALGGNALGTTPSEQLERVKSTAKQIVDLIKEGYKVVVTHGNGPQVGMINLALERIEGTNEEMPFAECGAMSQGYIGYHLQQCITDELNFNKVEQECVTIVTQVLVDLNDPAFKNPTKPIGSFYTEVEAKNMAATKGYEFKEDAGRGFRRVVPSPKPVKVLELKIIKELVDEGKIVISCGGGGIPVVETKTEGLEGVAAVIDKDMTSAKLAADMQADILLILTAVDAVYINYNKPEEIKLSNMTTLDAEKYIHEGQFAPGSMLPKIEACINFLNDNHDGQAIITSLTNAKEALQGLKGTIIKYGGKK